MTQIRFAEQTCQRVLAKLDAYLDNELLAETNLDLIEHLDRCPDCARELEARRAIRQRLRTAVREIHIPAGFEGRLRAGLRAESRPHNWSRHLMALAAAVAVCCGSWLAWQLGQLRVTASAQESYYSSLSMKVSSLMRVGLGDHVHCAVFRKYPKNPPATTADKLGPEFRDLLPIVEQRIPAGYPLVLAHDCRFGGRKFVHFTFKSDRNLVSLIIARKRDGESFQTDRLLPALTGSGIPIYSAGIQHFQLAAFESGDYLVYTVSDLPQRQNTEWMAALAPAIREFLRG